MQQQTYGNHSQLVQTSDVSFEGEFLLFCFVKIALWTKDFDTGLNGTLGHDHETARNLLSKFQRNSISPSFKSSFQASWKGISGEIHSSGAAVFVE